MLRDHKGDIAGFLIATQSWYHRPENFTKDQIEEITVGFYSPEGGTSGEFHFAWVSLGQNDVAVQLRAFDDGWSSLVNMPELLQFMMEHDGEHARGPHMTPEEFVEGLKNIGLVDMTKRNYEDSYPNEAA